MYINNMKIAKDILIHLYLDRKLRCPQIAKLLHCTPSHVYDNLRKYQIQTRPYNKTCHEGLPENSKFRLFIGKSIRSNKTGMPWESIVGYTIFDLKSHLEKQFSQGMTWDNYGKFGWHIDHIMPVSSFNFKTIHDIEFKECWALSNLRPLWAIDNLKKNNKITTYKPRRIKDETGKQMCIFTY